MTEMERDPLESQVHAWMQRFAGIDARPPRLPDASTLWIRARLLQSEAAAQRIARPITNAQIGAYLGVAALWAALLMWKWNALLAWIQGFTPTHIILGAAGAEASASLSLTFLAFVVVLASVTVMLAFHTILADD